MQTFYEGIGKSYHEELEHSYNWLIFSGTILAILSIFIIVDIYHPQLPVAYSSVAFFMISLIYFIHSFKFWYKKYIGYFIHIAAAALYFFIGLVILYQYLTFAHILLIATTMSFFVVGIFRITLATRQGIDYLGWGWTFICGIINILLATIIVLYQSTVAHILLIVSAGATDVLFTGLALLWLGLSYKLELTHFKKDINSPR